MNVDQVPSIELIIYSSIFLLSHRKACKCIIIIKTAEKKSAHLVEGKFLDELTFPLSSNYYHATQDVGGEIWEAGTGILFIC